MTWAVPGYTRAEVDVAGDVLIDDNISSEQLTDSLAIINNWRSSHAFPLNTFQVTLRNKSRLVDPNSLVAQRIKRLPAIDHKLRNMRRLKLSQVQDIGGCRAVLANVRRVNKLVRLYKASDLKHRLESEVDYIVKPRKSGYRGIHLIYSYHSDKTEIYEGLKIEMQLRSRLQHAWATAVETVSTFIGQSLKASQGDADWLRFFTLMGSAIALRENSPQVPGTPENSVELLGELRHYALKLDVDGKLRAYGAAIHTVRRLRVPMAKYFLLELDPAEKRISVRGYPAGALEQASTEYLLAERLSRQQPGPDAVLVSVESVQALRRAYPNYFLDTNTFLTELRRVMEDAGESTRP